MELSGHDVGHAVDLLRAGNPVAVPTETVYGLAARADDDTALDEIYRRKGRPSSNPLILHFAGAEMLTEWVAQDVPEEAQTLMAAFWPGPLTLLLPKGPQVSHRVCAGLPRVAVRVPEHSLFRSVIAACDVPLAAPSANPSGGVSPTSAAHVLHQYRDAPLPYVLDGGPCRHGVESTIVGWDAAGALEVLRPGAVTLEDLASTLGHSIPNPLPPTSRPQAPGMLPHHYAPQTPVRITDAPPPGPEVGWITWRGPLDAIGAHHIVLTRNSQLEEAARGLYAALIALDQQNLNAIHVQPFPDHGLGATLNERIARAEARTPNLSQPCSL